jgi:hypothetical protein
MLYYFHGFRNRSKKRKAKDVCTNLEEVTRHNEVVDLSLNGMFHNQDFTAELDEKVMKKFNERELLKEAFRGDPLNHSVYTKTENQGSFEKLPSLSSFEGSRAESSLSSYLSEKIFGRKKKSQQFKTKIGPKEIQLDPSRVVVFKKGRLLDGGYYIVEFSYTQRYF